MKSVMFFLTLAMTTVSLGAQPSDQSPHPCSQETGFADFDFWLGVWDVKTANGQVAGTNRIEKVESDCLILEFWEGAQGSTGRSINYYNPFSRQWRQVWISGASNGYLIDISGGIVDGSMILQGKISYYAAGSELPFRGTWTPLEDGRVRQFFEQSNDGGESWQSWFEGFYSRQDDGE